VFLAAHQLAKLTEVLLIAESPELEREIGKRASALVRLLESDLSLGRPVRGRNVIDARRRLRLRSLEAVLGESPPQSPPPRRSA
jgi:hypothetical protein